ncbi:MAG: hypothetical protein R2865_01695 [Deinococcales bacterium]
MAKRLWQLKLKNGKLKELIPDDYRLSEPYPSPDGSFIASLLLVKRATGPALRAPG